MAADYDEVIRAAAATSPQVLVTDIRMPPAFQREGIDAAKEVRKRQPGTGVVVLSEFEDPEYAVSLLAEGSAGYGYLLKDHVAEGDQLAEGVSAGDQGALRRRRLLHQAIVDRGEQGETLSRLLPGGLAEQLRLEHRGIGETERVEVTVLMSDIRSYSTIAEHADPSQLAGELNTHRAAMNRAILGEGGTVMQFVGDAVMAVFGTPFPQDDHADRAVAAAAAMHELQAEINARWERDGRPHRPRARPVHRSGGRGAAWLGRAAGIHPGGRHRQSEPAAAATGRQRRDDRVEFHGQGAHFARADHSARRPAGQGS